MDLALVTGCGPSHLTNIEGLGLLVRSDDAVAFAYRDHKDQEEYGSQRLPSQLKAIDLPAVRAMGIEAVAREAVEHLTREELKGFFIHLDADCLDDAIMPAVDFRMPGGLSWDELGALLRVASGSGKAVGIEITIYNPRLDKDSSAARGLADVLVVALGTAAYRKAISAYGALDPSERRSLGRQPRNILGVGAYCDKSTKNGRSLQ